MDHDKPLTTMTVTFDGPVPTGVETGGTVVENITATPSVVISGDILRDVRPAAPCWSPPGGLS